MKAAQSWAEQRFFNELAVLALEESNHPLAAEARQALTTVERVNVPQLPGRPLALTTLVTLATGPRLRFGEALGRLVGRNPAGWQHRAADLRR